MDAVLGHAVDQVVAEIEVFGDVRAVAAVDVDLEAVAGSDVLDEVVGDLVGAVAIDVDAVTLLGTALDVVDVVAEPDRAGAVAGDAGHPRYCRAARRSGGGGQVVVDHAPVMAVDLLADRPIVALAVDAQVADHRPLTHVREGLAVDRGNAAPGLAAGERTADVGVLGWIAHHGDGAGAGGAGGGAAGLVAEAHEVALKAHVGPGSAGTAQHDDVPRLGLAPGALGEGGGLHVAERMADVAGDGGGIVARGVVDEQHAPRVDHEGLIGVGGDPVDRHLDGQGGAGGRIAQGADLHGELLDVGAALGGAEVAVAADLDAADERLDGGAHAAAAEVLAEDRQVGALVVLTAGARA